MKPMTKRLSTDMGSRASLAALTCGIALTAALPAQAGIAIPNKPVDLGSSVPPNVMMILDDSGSMDDEDLYDDRVTITGGGLTGGTLSAVTHRAYTHNTLFYNPTVNYTPWVKADSSLLPNTPYTAVYTSRALASGTTT
ncbi:MAG: hypothetical protein IPH76_12555, partial [Xanthomonadales bacterium]|nr:hypothetical protein [Xanthomonadales bacterium]